MTDKSHHVTAHRQPDLGITALELRSAHSFPRHSHDEYGIGVVLAGAQRSWSGIGEVESLPGDVITVNPGELHDGRPLGGARRWRIIYVDPQTLTRRFLPEFAREIEFTSPSLRNSRLGDQVNRLFERLRGGAETLAVEEIVEPLVRRLSSDGTARAPARHSAPVAAARARIEDDPALPTSLAELAALSGVSRFQILRAFARELGTTPYAYVIQCRVRLARQMLARGETPAAVAQGAGFADQSHLTRAFTRHFGISPGRYRAAVVARAGVAHGEAGW